jgi:nicotinamidase/pyrazinamidase
MRAMRALLLVDLQYDFMPGGALAVPRGDETVAIANRLLPHFPIAAATQDWHPQNHESFKETWPVHCVQNTHGAELLSELERSRINEVFRKGMDPKVDSYSGFFNNDKKTQTGLAAWLKERWIERLYVMGLATDYCVRATVLDACALGFNGFLLEDGCRAVDKTAGDGERAIREMRGAGANVIESGAIGT